VVHMDAWIANLSDGSTKVEEWVAGYISPWQRLMEYCKNNGAYITNLRLTIGNKTESCPPNAAGYWQAHGMPAVQGVECDEDLHKWRGIGWIEGDLVQIIWGARDPQTHNVVFWRDSRPAKNQAQIVWARPQLTIPFETEISRSEEDVKNLKEFQDKMVADAGGLKEVHVPEHNH
jgi:hypothetical protein